MTSSIASSRVEWSTTSASRPWGLRVVACRGLAVRAGGAEGADAPDAGKFCRRCLEHHAGVSLYLTFRGIRNNYDVENFDLLKLSMFMKVYYICLFDLYFLFATKIQYPFLILFLNFSGPKGSLPAIAPSCGTQRPRRGDVRQACPGTGGHGRERVPASHCEKDRKALRCSA